MFDSRYFAFATISALLVMSPGATMAVVADAVLADGRAAGLITIVGVNVGNSTLALSSALGLSVVFLHWPSALVVLKVGGAIYLTYLGVRAVIKAWNGHVQAAPAIHARASAPHGTFTPRGAVLKGITTNLLNPPVVMFYAVFLPQFISTSDPFFSRFAVLAGTHIGMSLVWLSAFAVTMGVLADRLARPPVRRALDGVTGAILVGLGLRLLVR